MPACLPELRKEIVDARGLRLAGSCEFNWCLLRIPTTPISTRVEEVGVGDTCSGVDTSNGKV